MKRSRVASSSTHRRVTWNAVTSGTPSCSTFAVMHISAMPPGALPRTIVAGCSPLAQATGTSFLAAEPEVRIRLPWFRSVNFGLLDFEWEPEPKVTFTLRDLRGDRAWEPVTLTPAELRNGISTWADKMDAASRAHRELRVRAGRAGTELPLEEAFAHLPVALLEREP